jgi:hypothetical protein
VSIRSHLIAHFASDQMGPPGALAFPMWIGVALRLSSVPIRSFAPPPNLPGPRPRRWTRDDRARCRAARWSVYADAAGLAGVAVFAAAAAATKSPRRAAAAALTTLPRPARFGREGFTLEMVRSWLAWGTCC